MVYGGGYETCHQDLYDPTREQDLDGFDGFDCQAQCGLSFMYFEGISACVSLTTKHVYCVTPCQLNRLLLFLVTIDIKTSKDSQLHEEAQAQHRPAHGRQEMLKAWEE